MDPITIAVDDSVAAATVGEPERSRALIRLRDRYAADALPIAEFSQALEAVLHAHTSRELGEASPAIALPIGASERWRDAESLERHLVPGEAILWTGRPVRGFVRPTGRVAYRLVIIGSLGLMSFVGNVWGGEGPDVLASTVVFWGGLAYAVSRGFIFTRRRRARVLYLLTTARVARLTRGWSGEKMDSMLLSAVPSISVTPGKGARGTIRFSAPAPTSPFNSTPASGRTREEDEPAIRFMNVPDAADVTRLISTLRTHASDDRP